ncbi:MAG: hypothetical protein JXB30_18965 [Anaerolineae bacterium]|nr:hypothetical protein [Anaerolineae bacterium]
MTIIVEKLPDGPVILASYQEPMNWEKETPDMFEQIFAIRDTFEGYPKYYTIIDVSAVKVGFGEMVLALGEVRKASKRRRPDMPIRISLVGSGNLVELASKAMEQHQYGEYRVPLYTSLDKTLDDIRADIASWSK